MACGGLLYFAPLELAAWSFAPQMKRESLRPMAKRRQHTITTRGGLGLDQALPARSTYVWFLDRAWLDAPESQIEVDEG